MIENAEAVRAAVERRFAQVARSPDQERKFPVGPASAKSLATTRRRSTPCRPR